MLFRSTIIIFVSDIGNKEIISQLVGPGSHCIVQDRDIEQVTNLKITNCYEEDVIESSNMCTLCPFSYTLPSLIPNILVVVVIWCLGQGPRGFRSELLNRVDEIVFFNPFIDEQLQKVARLSMRSGRHLEEGNPCALPASFRRLFSLRCDHVSPFFLT